MALQSCANHSCAPNAATEGEGSGATAVIARQRIQTGEEITISYINDAEEGQPMTYEQRQVGLGVWCLGLCCGFCATLCTTMPATFSPADCSAATNGAVRAGGAARLQLHVSVCAVPPRCGQGSQQEEAWGGRGAGWGEGGAEVRRPVSLRTGAEVLPPIRAGLLLLGSYNHMAANLQARPRISTAATLETGQKLTSYQTERSRATKNLVTASYWHTSHPSHPLPGLQQSHGNFIRCTSPTVKSSR